MAPSVEERVQVLLTAAEAFPVLERAFLEAQSEITAGFRIFDLRTSLHSDAARAIGRTWFDLLLHTLRRGVSVRLVLSDFDPIARPQLHRGSWRSVRMFVAAAELAGPKARLEIVPAMHSAISGPIPRAMFWPVVRSRLMRALAWVSEQPDGGRIALLRDLPGIRALLTKPDQMPLRASALPPPMLFPATHHQKLAVFDRKRLYIGGLDLDDRRFDTPDHDRPGHETWHDLQLMVQGPVVADALAHLENFLDAVAGRSDPVAQAPDRDGFRFVRTLSRAVPAAVMRVGPAPAIAEIAQAHHALAAKAERLVYLETQYFRDRQLAQALADAGRKTPGLGLILILPAAPDDVAFHGADGVDARLGEFLQARALRILKRGFGHRLFVGGAAQPRRTSQRGREQLRGAPLVYIHAKLSVFDETAAIVSSANLNGRSLRWDTEAGLVLSQGADVAMLRRRAMAHWLPEGAPDRFFNMTTAVQSWAGLALANARRPPEQRQGFILPYDRKAAEKFGQAFPLLPDDML